MAISVLARGAGVLGGLVWVLRWIAEAAGAPPLLVSSAYSVGLVLLVVGTAGSGADLVRREVAWLRVVVAVALPTLALCVLAVLHDAGAGEGTDGVLGLAAVATWSAVAVRRRDRTRRRAGQRRVQDQRQGQRRIERQRPRSGAHAG